MNKKSMSFSNIGTVSLLMIFIVLCLVTFAVLSLSNTVSNHNYAKKLADSNTDYYTACNKANEIIDEIEQTIEPVKNSAKFASKTAKLLKAADISGLTFDKKSMDINYSVPINSTQNLDVTLHLNTSATGVEYSGYTITKWQKSTTEFESDDTIDLL